MLFYRGVILQDVWNFGVPLTVDGEITAWVSLHCALHTKRFVGYVFSMTQLV